MTYHVGIKKGVSFLCNGYVEYTLKEYWTSVKTDERENVHYIRYLAKANLMKQIAYHWLGNIRLWKHIELDSVDLVVEEA